MYLKMGGVFKHLNTANSSAAVFEHLMEVVFYIFNFYFVLECIQVILFDSFSLTANGQLYECTCPFSPKLPSHPGCHIEHMSLCYTVGPNRYPFKIQKCVHLLLVRNEKLMIFLIFKKIKLTVDLPALSLIAID